MPEARIKILKHYGTSYGGWFVAPELLPKTGTIIDAGVGTDTSFCERVRDEFPGLDFIGIDHTEEASEYAAKRGCYKQFIKAAVVGDERLTVEMFKNAKGGSESILADHNFVGNESYRVPAVRLKQLVEFYKPCAVKLDCEGIEYSCYRDCFGVPQVAIEFHSRMLRTFTDQDTDRIVAEFKANGYELAHMTERHEALFVQGSLGQGGIQLNS